MRVVIEGSGKGVLDGHVSNDHKDAWSVVVDKFCRGNVLGIVVGGESEEKDLSMRIIYAREQ